MWKSVHKVMSQNLPGAWSWQNIWVGERKPLLDQSTLHSATASAELVIGYKVRNGIAFSNTNLAVGRLESWNLNKWKLTIFRLHGLHDEENAMINLSL